MRLEYLLIKKVPDEFCCTEDQLKNLLLSNSRIAIEGGDLIFKKARFVLAVGRWDVGRSPKETVFHLTLSSASEDADTDERLDEFDTLTRHVNEKCGNQFIISTIWDDASVYFERLLYPRTVRIEKKGQGDMVGLCGFPASVVVCVYRVGLFHECIWRGSGTKNVKTYSLTMEASRLRYSRLNNILRKTHDICKAYQRCGQFITIEANNRHIYSDRRAQGGDLSSPKSSGERFSDF